MPNFIEEAEMLEWAGVCFGEEDTYRLAKSIKVNSKMLIPVVATGSYEWRRQNQVCRQDSRNIERLLASQRSAHRTS